MSLSEWGKVLLRHPHSSDTGCNPTTWAMEPHNEKPGIRGRCRSYCIPTESGEAFVGGNGAVAAEPRNLAPVSSVDPPRVDKRREDSGRVAGQVVLPNDFNHVAVCVIHRVEMVAVGVTSSIYRSLYETK